KAQEQGAALENILSQEKQVDGILIVPLEKKKIYHVIKPHLKKIPVISLTMQLHSDIAHIGTDYHRQGRIVANILAHCLRRGESLVILDNGDDKLSTQDYLEGFCERISEEELDILGPYSCQGIQESVELLKKLSQEKKIRGVFSNRYAQDIMKELPDSWFVGKHIVVNGMSEEIEQLLLEKKIIATVTEEVYEEASFAGKLLFQTLYQNKKIPKIWSKTNSKIIYLENLEKK
ncbi:substrate-binding domain-containing protein, partial [Fusobacterium necrophorum]|nr:substrate-binding domain-containing protein [Fusobacterium necrophorum]